MGEKGRVNTAVGILAFTGGLVVYSAFEERFKVPGELWGIATAAAAYYFTTAKRRKPDEDEDEEEHGDA